MDRKAFLALAGAGATSAAFFQCTGCSKSSDHPATAGPSGVNFTLDLTESANASLLTIGGALAKNGVLVARPQPDRILRYNDHAHTKAFRLFIMF